MSASASPCPSPTPPRASYAAVLRVPHARRTFLAALTARLSYGTVSVAVLLSVTGATGSYAVAGLVGAVLGGATVFLMPLRAGVVDRYGPRRALPALALPYSALLAVFAALTWRPGAPDAVLVVIAALMGACAPPLGPTMRAVWSRLVDSRPLLQRAYSLDGVAEELLFVCGPLAVGVLLRLAPAPAGVLLSAVLMVAGTGVFVASPAVGAVPAAGPARGRRRVRGLPAGLFVPVVAAAGVGLTLSGVELLVLAFAGQRTHDDGVVPWILGALSAGSAVGGLLNGAVDWRRPARARLPWLTAGLGAVLGLAGLAPGLWTLAAVMACAGAFVAPALTTAYLLAEETAPQDARTRAGAWVNAAVNAGSSGGAALAGLLVGRVSVAACFALAGGVALATALLVRGHATGTARTNAQPAA